MANRQLKQRRPAQGRSKAFRQEWKANYAKLSADIRAQKRGRKQFIRSYVSHETPQGKVRELVSKVANPHFGDYQMWQLAGLQDDARSQMEILKDAKALSWTLIQSAKASVVPAA